MLHHAEGLQGLCTDALGGGVRGQELGVLRLQFLQLPHQGVVLGVADFRAVEHVVTVVVVLYFGSQPGNSLFGFFGLGHGVLTR